MSSRRQKARFRLKRILYLDEALLDRSLDQISGDRVEGFVERKVSETSGGIDVGVPIGVATIGGKAETKNTNQKEIRTRVTPASKLHALFAHAEESAGLHNEELDMRAARGLKEGSLVDVLLSDITPLEVIEETMRRLLERPEEADHVNFRDAGLRAHVEGAMQILAGVRESEPSITHRIGTHSKSQAKFALPLKTENFVDAAAADLQVAKAFAYVSHAFDNSDFYFAGRMGSGYSSDLNDWRFMPLLFETTSLLDLYIPRPFLARDQLGVAVLDTVALYQDA